MAEPKHTLDDVIWELSESRETAENTNDALNELNETMSSFVKRMKMEDKRDKLQDKEDSIENRNKSRVLETPSFNVLGMKDDVKGIFAGSSVADTIASISTAVGAFLPRILALGRLFLKGGLIGGLIFAMYKTFEDIGENENFKKAIAGISDTWNNRIVPSWNEIKEKFSNLLNSEEILISIASMGISLKGIVDLIKSIGPNIKESMQNFVSDTITVFGDTVAGVLENFSLLLDGDWKNGILGLATTLMDGVKGITDNIINSILTALGFEITFDEMKLKLANKIIELKDNIVTSMTNAIDYSIEKVMDIKDSIMTSISETVENAIEKFRNVKDTALEKIGSVKDAITDMIDRLGEAIGNIDNVMTAAIKYNITKIYNGFQTSFEKITTWVSNLGDKLYLFLAENFKFKFPEINVPIPNWLGGGEFNLVPGFEMGAGREAVAATRERIRVREQESDDRIQALQSDTADALKKLTDALDEMKRKEGARPIVVAPSSSVSNVQSNSTSFSIHPSSRDIMRPL